MFELIKARDPVFTDDTGNRITLMCVFKDSEGKVYDEMPYTAGVNDPVSKELFDRAFGHKGKGEFGKVAAYAAPAVTAANKMRLDDMLIDRVISSGYSNPDSGVNKRMSLYGYLAALNGKKADGSITKDEEADLATLLLSAQWEQDTIDAIKAGKDAPPPPAGLIELTKVS